MHLEQKAVRFRECCAHSFCYERGGCKEKVQLPCYGNMPSPIDPADFANPVRDPMVEFFTPIAATQFNVFIWCGSFCEVKDEVIYDPTGLYKKVA